MNLQIAFFSGQISKFLVVFSDKIYFRYYPCMLHIELLPVRSMAASYGGYYPREARTLNIKLIPA